VGQFECIGKLRPQEGVAFAVGQFVQAVFEGVEVAVVGPVDPAAVGQAELVFFVQL
jgi:hypothetical protein